MSFFADLQKNIKDRLEDATALGGLNYFQDMMIITEDQGDIETAISKSLSRLGISIVVLLADADCDKQNVSTPYLDNIRTVVEVAENVVINRSRTPYKHINDVVEHVMLYVHGFKPPSVNEVFVLDKAAVRTVEPPPGASVARHISFTTSGGFKLST